MPPSPNTPSLMWLRALVDSKPWPDACAEFPDVRFADGYGQVRFRKRNWKAHRVAYTLAFGEIPPGLVVRHGKEQRCVSRLCCNPGHLTTGTPLDNSADMIRDGMSTVGARNGAYTKPDSRPRGDRNGSRTKPESRPRGDAHWTRINPERLPSMKGEKNPLAKLTEDKVRDIRRRFAAGERGVALAVEYGVSDSLITMVVKRRVWAHVE